jgi:anti-anti-sigma factor
VGVSIEGYSGLLVTRPLTGLVVIEVRCELDALTVPALGGLIGELLEDGCRALLLDLYSCPFLGSAGLAALVDGHDQATAAGTRFALIRPSAIGARALATTGLDSHFQTFPSLTAAVVDMADG